MKLPVCFLIAAIIGSIGLTACNNSESNVDRVSIPDGPAPPPKITDTFSVRHVIADVNSQAAPGESYSLYLPGNYTGNSQLPVVILLDPHGEGQLPVSTYAALAEAAGVILIGSDNSENGQQLQQGIEIANHLVNEALLRYHADKSRVTLAGFSGGAKVAMLAGTANNAVARIVYCGAVQPWQNLEHPVEILGFAGTRDMNYSGLVTFFTNAQYANIPHYLIEWDGPHQWPDTTTFKWVFYNNWKEIPPSALIKVDNRKLSALKTEETTKQQYLQSFDTRDISWWKTEINRLNMRKKASAADARLLGYISLACYSIANHKLDQNDLPGAQKILTIYQLADPENKDCALLWSQYRQKAGK